MCHNNFGNRLDIFVQTNNKLIGCLNLIKCVPQNTGHWVSVALNFCPGDTAQAGHTLGWIAPRIIRLNWKAEVHPAMIPILRNGFGLILEMLTWTGWPLFKVCGGLWFMRLIDSPFEKGMMVRSLVSVECLLWRKEPMCFGYHCSFGTVKPKSRSKSNLWVRQTPDS